MWEEGRGVAGKSGKFREGNWSVEGFYEESGWVGFFLFGRGILQFWQLSQILPIF